MKQCPSCGILNKDTSRFCSSCGKKLAAKIICPYCKKEIKPTDKYCNSCGKSLKEEDSKQPEHLKTNQKKRLSRKARIALIVSISFIGFLILAFLGLFLFTNFYLTKKYSISYSPDGSVRLVTAGSSPSFGDLEISSEIDKQTFEPLTIQSEFEEGFREVFATIYVSGVSLDDEFSFKWKEADADEYIIDFKFKYFFNEGHVPNYISIPEEENIEDFKIFNKTGNYIVEFYHNDGFIDSADFKVIESTETSNQDEAEYDSSEDAVSSDTADATQDSESYESTEDGAAAETYSELWFGDLQTCEGLDENDYLINPGKVFDYGTDIIFAAIDVWGATEEDDWMFIWISGFTNKATSTYWGKYFTEEVEEYSYSNLSTAVFLAEGTRLEDHDILGKPGDHIVEFYHNGGLIDKMIFKIE